MHTPDTFGEPTHIPGSLKIRTNINDARRVQIHVIEEALGCLRLRVRTDALELDVVVAETSIRTLAERFAEAVQRLDTYRETGEIIGVESAA